MAKRKAASKTAKTAKAAASPTDTLGADPVDAALALIAETGWLKLSLHAVAERSGLGLAELYRRYSSKAALLRGFAARIDAAMLAALGPFDAAETGDSAETGGGDAVRDRLFEAVMARLDALAPHKPAMQVLARELPRDPAVAICFAADGLAKALDWTLAAAGLDAAGLQGLLRRKALGAVYLDTLRIWLKDDEPDLARTMAHLDKRLRQAQPFLLGRTGPSSGEGFLSLLRRKAT